MNIAVVGTGYVGLVSGTCFAETGHNVLCIDIDQAKVDRLRQGEIPIYEPGLQTIFDRCVRSNRLRFDTDLQKAVDHAEVIFLALPTPPGADGSADLKYILGVAKDLSKMIKSYTVIVDKSTVPVGTAELVAKELDTHLSKDQYDVVSNPEFLREGAAVDDFLRPDRIVIGADTERAFDVMKELYKPFVRQGNPIYTMDLRSAEMTKYAANSYLATRISFMNEIANLCEKTGANVDHVRLGIGSDSRIGKRFLFAGVGYGGSCFPKDVQALVKTADEHQYDFKILKSVIQANNNQKRKAFQFLQDHYGTELENKKIAVWGLAFKPNTDDIREAPALYLIDELLQAGSSIKVFDPEAMDNVRNIYQDKLEYASSYMNTIEDADALVIMTEWQQFRNPDFEKMHAMIKDKVMFDGRNLFDPKEMQENGFIYDSIGRPL